MIFLGWSLIFYADPDSIQNPTTKTFPNFFGHIWYITYVMFSVGNGDFVPNSDAWMLLSSVVAFGGMGNGDTFSDVSPAGTRSSGGQTGFWQPGNQRREKS